MVKQAPTVGRMLAMAFFTLSCFGLLLFLWLSFGGSVPLKPKGYRVQVAFPEAAQLGLYADVRTAGVSVGKVRVKALDPKGNRTLATLELDRRFAPLHADARAILRQKTLLGETYVELTPGTKAAPAIPEGGRLANARVAKTVQLDEIFGALDPQTRRSFQTWQGSLAEAIDNRGQSLNDAIGNLPGFAADTSDVLAVADAQRGAVQRLVKNTGVVFGALSENEAQLRNLVTGSGRVFDATARQQDALAETFSILPTFIDESKATLQRVERFSRNTRPLVRDLRPVARDLRPTLRDVRAFSPDLERFLTNLDPLIAAAKTGLPALRDTLKGVTPLLAELDPFLSQLNPILQWLEFNQLATADFIANGAGALADTTSTATGDELGHYLRQFGPTGPETVAMYPQRPVASRGNAYLGPNALQGPGRAAHDIFPSFDCKNAPGGGEYRTQGLNALGRDDSNGPDCWVQPGGFPKLQATSYALSAKQRKRR